jgi:LCP family protein required for cell wall assembly
MSFLYVAAGFVPGVSQLLRRRRVWALSLGAVCAVAAGVVVSAVVSSAWLFDPVLLRRAVVAVVVVAVAVVVSVVETWVAVRPGRVASVMSVFVALPAVAVLVTGVLVMWSQASAVEQMSARTSAGPAASPPVLPPTVLPPPTSRPSSVPVTSPRPVSVASTSLPAPFSVSTSAVPAVSGEGRWNILLLGGDAGPGRYSLRTDAMVLVSIDRVSGDVATVSVPRNMQSVPLPPGQLVDRFGERFDDLLNAVYTKVAAEPGVFSGVSDDAAADAVAAVIANLLGVRIDDWVLVDMRGFVEVIDALGGVDVMLPDRVVMPGNPGGAKHDVPFAVGPGLVHLDGTLALGFARSRSQDSDYRRMGRQRCLLEAAFEQHSVTDLVFAYPALLDVVASTVRTTLTSESFVELFEFAPRAARSTRALLLVPPVVKPSRPDVLEIRALVADFLAPAPPVAGPVPSQPPVSVPPVQVPEPVLPCEL